MKTATYHQASGDSKELIVLEENDDKTVNLGLENGVAIVTGCRVTDGVEVGACTIIAPKQAAKKITKKKLTN